MLDLVFPLIQYSCNFLHCSVWYNLRGRSISSDPKHGLKVSCLRKVKSESEVTQSCPTLCNPTDCSLSGSSVHGIFQARVLEWGAISFSRVSSWTRDQTQVSCIIDTLPSEPPGKSSCLRKVDHKDCSRGILELFPWRWKKPSKKSCGLTDMKTVGWAKIIFERGILKIMTQTLEEPRWLAVEKIRPCEIP